MWASLQAYRTGQGRAGQVGRFCSSGARRLIQQTMKCAFFFIIIIFMNTDFEFLFHLLGKSRFSRLTLASINVQIQSVLSGGGATLTLF